MLLIAITNRPQAALRYEGIGIDRIMVDLERLGKVERQRGKQSWISEHSLADVSLIRSVLRTATLMVRIDPMNETSESQIEEAIARGADVLMLPMAHEPDQIRRFVASVAGRARTCLLLETADALARADDIVAISDLDEIHVGLNDLHLTLGMSSMFEILADGLLDHLADRVALTGKLLGVGGIASLGQAEIDPKLILGEHIRLGSRMVILSRSFFAGLDVESSPEDLSVVSRRVQELRAYVASLLALPREWFVANREALKDNVERHVHTGVSRRSAST